MFSLTSSAGGVSGTISNIDGAKKNVIWSSILKEWLPTFAGENNVILTTKPSASSNGVSYILNLVSKSFKKIGLSLPGLTVSASANLEYVLYSQADVKNQSIIFGLLDKSGKDPTPLFLKTLPEKCTWSVREASVIFCAIPDSIPAATYPDDWYQSKVSFSDSIWKINLKTGEARDIAPIREMVKQEIDGINLSLDSKEDYLLFTNKKDLTLWGLQIKAPIVSTTTATTTR